MSVEVLPPQRTAYENAVEQAGAARIDAINPEILETLIDPYTIPIALLPWLAWQLKVEIWNDSWSEQRKRWVVAQSIRMHKLKGTLAGIVAYLGLVDTDVLDVVVPPAKTFLAPAFSKADRDAYLAMFPQLRVFPFVANAVKRYADFTSSAFGLSKAFAGKMYPMYLGADHRYTRTSVLFDRGVSTNLTLRTITPEVVSNTEGVSYDEIVFAAIPTRQYFPGASPKRQSFLGSPFDPTRIARVPVATDVIVTEPRETFTTVTPGLGLVSVTPDDVAQQHGTQKGQLFASRFMFGIFLPPSIAWKNIYQRWYLFDPSRVPQSRKSWVHLGHTRLGIPPYNAELKVRINGKLSPFEFGRFVRGHLRGAGTTQQQIDDARSAVRIGMSVRDKILLRTKTKRPFQPSDLRKVGSITVGALIDTL